MQEMQETWIWSLVREDPFEKGMVTHSSILALENPLDSGDWWAVVHGVAESQTRLKWLSTKQRRIANSCSRIILKQKLAINIWKSGDYTEESTFLVKPACDTEPAFLHSNNALEPCRRGAGSDGKASACSAGGLGSIPGLGRSPGGRQENPLGYCCLENSTDWGAWRTTVQAMAKSQTQLSD